MRRLLSGLTVLTAGLGLFPSAVAGDTAARARAGGIESADLRVLAGEHGTVLHVPRVGTWSAACVAGALRVRFTADRLLATSDVVVTRTAGPPLALTVNPGDRVTPDPAGPVLAQRWQIAPFASGGVRVTAASVAGRATASFCSASVVAVTGLDQGPTR